MTEQAKPGPDYSRQKLAGRSFRGLDLRGAVFCNADLRGVDFRDADLTGADFCGSRMGKTGRRRLMELPVQLALGILLFMLISAGMVLLGTGLIQQLSKVLLAQELTTNATFYWAVLPWIGLQAGFVWAARRGQLEWFLAGTGLFMAVAVVVAVVGKRALAAGAVKGTIGAMAGASVGAVAGTGALVLATGTLAVAVALMAVAAVSVAAVAGRAWAMAVAVAVSGLCLGLVRRLGLWLGQWLGL